jgi:hypothetical protein
MKGDYRPRYASNSRVFEKRGDPWVTRREGVKDFARNIETEDADRDFDHRFHNTGFGPKEAAPHPEHKAPRPAPKEDDFLRRKANIARRMNKSINARAPREIASAPVAVFRPCAGCRSAQCVAKGTCLIPR